MLIAKTKSIYKKIVTNAYNSLCVKSNNTNSNIETLIDFLNLNGVSHSALNEATYFACLKVLSESIGKLPLKIQQFTEKGGIRIAYEHRFYKMLNLRPNINMTSTILWSTLENCRNHFGNAYAYIDTSDMYKPQLIPVDPRKVKILYDDAGKFKANKKIWYRVSTQNGEIIIDAEDMLHFKSHNTLDGIVGISVREQLAETIKGSVESQKMLNSLYESGMSAKAVLQYTGGLDDAKVELLARNIEEYAQGKKRNQGIANIIPLPIGITLTPINMKLADSQFIELRQYSALQIASAFGIKPYQVGDYTKSSYASAEAQQLSFLIDTLLYIIKQYEEEIAYKLLTERQLKNGYHVKFNTAAMLRVDFETTIRTLSTAVNSFLYTPNEARQFLDKPSVDGGDKLLGNGTSIPVDLTGSQYINENGRR